MKCLILCVGVLMMAFGAHAATKYRDFTSAEGKTIKAAVKSYDAQKKMVTMERDNRKIMKVSISVFSEADQAYILEWEVLRCFSTERFLKISTKRKKMDNDEESSAGSYRSMTVEDTGYEIRLENRSATGFSNLKIDYCIFYEQEESSPSGNVTHQGVYCGDLSIEDLAAKSKMEVLTKTVSTYTKELGSGVIYLSGAENVQHGDVHGIWIRLYMTLPSGEKGMREMCYPDSLSNSKAWMTSSIRAGRN